MATGTEVRSEALGSSKRLARRDATTQKLFEAVYAAPEDDAPRLVLADHLQQSGDPRGELIALQCSAQSEQHTERVAALLRKHARTWLDDLAPAIRLKGRAARTPVFRRGFLAAATVEMRGGAVESSPAWSTLEELWFWGASLRPAMRRARILHMPPVDVLVDPKGPTWLARELELDLFDLDACAALAKTDRLPELCVLHVRGQTDWVFESRFSSQLEVLRVEPKPGEASAALMAKASKMKSLRKLIFDLTFLGESCAWIHEGTLTFDRDDDFAKGVLTPGDASFDPKRSRSPFVFMRDVPMQTLVIERALDGATRDAVVAAAEENGPSRLEINGETFTLAARVRPATPKPSALEGASCIAFDPEGRLYAAVGTSVVADGARWPCEWRIDALAASHEQVAAGFSCYVRLFDRRTGEALRRVRATSGTVESLAFSPDGATLAVGSSNGTVTLVSSASGNPQPPLKLHKSAVWSLTFAPDGKTFASSSSDNTIRIVDVGKRRTIQQITAHGNAVTDVVLTTDALFSSSHDRTIRRFSTSGAGLSTYERKKKRADEFAGAWALTRTPHALAVAWYEGQVTLHDLSTLELRREAVVGKRATDIACSPDGKRLAIVNDTRVCFLDAETLELL